jgi:hypothetical protein
MQDDGDCPACVDAVAALGPAGQRAASMFETEHLGDGQMRYPYLNREAPTVESLANRCFVCGPGTPIGLRADGESQGVSRCSKTG